MNIADQPAYPVSKDVTDKMCDDVEPFCGLTVKQKLSAMNMAQMAVNGGSHEELFCSVDSMAEVANKMADALIKSWEGG